MGAGCQKERPEVRLLVFTKTAGYRHGSIPKGIEAIKRYAEPAGIKVDTTENAAKFNEENLAKYSAVIFLSTTGDVLNHIQQADFERYIQAGGGYVGIHAASDCEYEWPWYNKLVGAYFKSHPAIQDANIKVLDKKHPSTEMLPDVWKRKDEWYNFRDGSVNPDVKVLMELDETSYQGGEMSAMKSTNGKHPIAWYHDFDGGRAFYTELGHTDESYSEDLFLKHLAGGIRYAIGENLQLDYSKAKSQRVPDETRFNRSVLDENLNEPTQMEVLSNGDVLFVERRGAIKKYDTAMNQTLLIDSLKVYYKLEDGLIGLDADPNYDENHWIYLFYSSPTDSTQHISRFVFKDNKLDKSSEKVLLAIPVQRKECCHSGGGLEFDSHGNLFIGLGDNTNPFFSDGYDPIDESKGRGAFDAQRTSANTNSLVGKILRIHPEADGTYSIPEGNLFPKGTPNTRPEIYVMGDRNPYRFTIDPRTNYLYWGEVGPDAVKDSTGRGPRGHDEVNQAKKAGFFGWPYFVGDNKPYNNYDFVAKKSGDPFDPAHPYNESPNNTGLKELPPAQPAFIWYPYAVSKEFPELGSGGRTAMAGVFYYSDQYKSDVQLPSYYDGKLLIYDWIRDWMFMVTMDEKGDFVQTEPFLKNIRFHNPIDIQYGKDGAMYVLEYGESWNTRNMDARLNRITFNKGNRPPDAKIEEDRNTGSLPLTVNFSAAQSTDADRDSLTYAWSFDGDPTQSTVQATTKKATYTFSKAGEYRVKLVVTDANGGKTEAYTRIVAGNESPVISWNVPNQTFYWENQPLAYAVNVSDKEDGTIDPTAVSVTKDYLGESFDQAMVGQGHITSKLTADGLLKTYNCFSCHKIDSTNVGPAYTKVAAKYRDKKGSMAYLMNKIRNGGNGVWGEQNMPANPQLSDEELQTVISFILSLNDKKKDNHIAMNGSVMLRDHIEAKNSGLYLFKASYMDRGANNLPPLTTTSTLALRNPKVQAESAEIIAPSVQIEGDWLLKNLRNGAFIAFKNMDLTGVGSVDLSLNGTDRNGRVEVRLDGLNGQTIGTLELKPDGKDINIPFAPTSGKHTLYFVFRNDIAGDINIASLDWLVFKQGSKSVAKA
jgi:cytochrome c